MGGDADDLVGKVLRIDVRRFRLAYVASEGRVGAALVLEAAQGLGYVEGGGVPAVEPLDLAKGHLDGASATDGGERFPGFAKAHGRGESFVHEVIERKVSTRG